MAHKINDILNKLEKKEKKICDSGCVFFRFPHLDIACVLSEVFSVRQGQGCYEYKESEIKING